MKILKKRNQIYALGTSKSVSASIEQAKKIILNDFKGSGFIYVDHPNGLEKYIIFGIPINQDGSTVTAPIRIDIPDIYEKQVRKEVYREKESYRALVLILKAKLILMENGEPKEKVFYLDQVDKKNNRLFPSPSLLLPY